MTEMGDSVESGDFNFLDFHAKTCILSHND